MRGQTTCAALSIPFTVRFDHERRRVHEERRTEETQAGRGCETHGERSRATWAKPRLFGSETLASDPMKEQLDPVLDRNKQGIRKTAKRVINRAERRARNRDFERDTRRQYKGYSS